MLSTPNHILIDFIPHKTHFRPTQLTPGYPLCETDEEFIHATDNISLIFTLIWGQSTNTHSVTECLHIFYDIISISGKHILGCDKWSHNVIQSTASTDN